MAAARMGRGRGQRKKKKAELYTFMLPEVTNTSSPCFPICMQGSVLPALLPA